LTFIACQCSPLGETDRLFVGVSGAVCVVIGVGW
jgi:hypothetical protein